MTQEELSTLINYQVVAALAAFQAGQPAHHPPTCTYKSFMDCKPHNFGGSEGAIGLLRWFEKVESCFAMCNCPPADRVKYATATLEN